MKSKSRNLHSLLSKLALLAALLMFSSTGAQTFAQTLFPDTTGSNPTDAEANVGRQKGRKGLLYHFKFFNAASVEDDSAFPLNMSAATVTLTIGGTMLTCTPGTSPAPNACAHTVVAGEDDPALDTVKILYNGDFPSPATNVQIQVTGARTTTPVVNQSLADPNTVNFSTLASGTLRAPASLELVFDISGSMGWPAVPGGPVSRMDALKQGSQSFFAVLNSYAMLGDQVGVVYFSDDATVFDPTPGGSNLAPAHDPTQSGAVAASIQSQVPTNGTSIGDGLQKANSPDGFSADPATTKLVFLFSDGEQNTPNFARVVGPNLTIVDSESAGATTLMTYPNNIGVCPITAGRLTAPGNVLQQQIAGAKCNNNNAVVGDMANTFAPADLNTYFTQRLQTVLVGDKLENVRNVTGKIPVKTDVKEKFFANSNDVALSLLLSWGGGIRTVSQLPFRLKAPDGTIVDVENNTQRGFGMSFTTIHFPLRRNNVVIAPKGEWEIELLGSLIDPIGAVAEPLDYQLIVMLDNANIVSDYSIGGNDIGTGEAVPIQLKLKENEAPVPGATVVAQLLGPDNGLGNILSTANTPSGTPNIGGDPVVSEAQRKLLLLLADPASAALFANKNLPSVVLLDNGQAANGDTVANDGNYSALFTGALQEGHYRFIVNAQGATTINGTFQRTQTLTVFVRPKPTATETTLTLLSSTPRQTDNSVLVRLSATPKDRFGNRIGPGYRLGQINFKSTEGTVETPLADKLDGSYEISYRLPSASSNPNITLEVLGTEVVTKPLNQIGNTGGVKFKRYAFSLHGGGTFPHNSFGNFFDSGASFAADFEYRLTPLFSLEAYVGHDRFNNKFFTDDFHLTHVSGHAKFTFGTGTVRPSIHAGLGGYFPEGGGARFGGNIGASLQFWITPNFALEPSYNFRVVNFSGSDLKYSTLQGGLRFRF